MFQSIQKIHIYRMRIPVHHHDNSQPNTHLGGSHHHDKKDEQLSVNPCIWVRKDQRMLMHLGKSYQQQIHGIQHQLNTHEDNDCIAPGEHTSHPDTEQRY